MCSSFICPCGAQINRPKQKHWGVYGFCQNRCWRRMSLHCLFPLPVYPLVLASFIRKGGSLSIKFVLWWIMPLHSFLQTCLRFESFDVKTPRRAFDRTGWLFGLFFLSVSLWVVLLSYLHLILLSLIFQSFELVMTFGLYLCVWLYHTTWLSVPFSSWFMHGDAAALTW